ncbi:hypothetical protein [Haladaptatus halobius]|jgi:hypothetical protein|uniref:hypothetical protein n=1 Tax=Haladaptatus halobius TaxID=2884875 RepID=UPI001D09CD2A|nr:hypothetical protein [Haladaptatus halobius]
MEIERARDELNVTGDFDESAAEEHPTIVRMMQDVLEHGEVHAKWADSDEYVEVRQGTATFDFEGAVILLDDGITTHTFAMAQVVSWEKPMNVFESEA